MKELKDTTHRFLNHAELFANSILSECHLIQQAYDGERCVKYEAFTVRPHSIMTTATRLKTPNMSPQPIRVILEAPVFVTSDAGGSGLVVDVGYAG